MILFNKFFILKNVNKKDVMQWLLFLAIFMFFILLTNNAFASADAGGGFEYENWLTKIVNSIKGPVAYAIGIASIVAAGAMLAWGGELSGFIKTLVYIACVLGFIIGAAKFLSNLTGVGAMIGF